LKAKVRLAFAELEVLTGAGLAGFLPLTHAGITGKEALGLEGGSQFGIVQKQGAGNT
jgi:hypothetical protein